MADNYTRGLRHRGGAGWIDGFGRSTRWLAFVVAIVASSGLHCFDSPDDADPTSARTIWHVPGAGWSQPSYDEGTAYFTGFNHDVVAVNKQTGAERWRTLLPYVATCYPPDSHTVGFASTIAGGAIITMDDGVIALDTATGAHRWSFHPPEGCIAGTSAPGSEGPRVFVGASRGSVYAIDAVNGQTLWRGQFLSDAIAYSPMSTASGVYAEFNVQVSAFPFDSGGVVALDAQTGATRWIAYFPRLVAGCPPRGTKPVVVSGSLVIAPSDNGAIYAMSSATGAVVWTAPRFDSTQLCDDRPVAVSGTRVFVGSNSGRIVALDAGTGQEIWRTETQYQAAGLTTDESTVYARIGAASTVALDAATGQTRWKVGLLGGGLVSILTAATVDSDRIYAGASTGFYAFRAH